MTTTTQAPAPAVAPEAEERPNDWTGLILLIGAIIALGVFASWSWAFIVVAIIFMIFMHEMGHFITAKLTGMKVTEFFIGFGPRIWSFHKGETEYGFKLIPAGAYVRIIGMNNLDDVEPGDEDRAYRVKSYPRKLLVVTAGSGMHFLMALVFLFGFLVWQGVPADNGAWVVGSVSDRSAAAELGIEPGDEVVSVAGVPIEDFQQFGDVISANGGQAVEVVYRADGETITDSVVLGARLTREGAAEIRGLEERDRILQIDGIDVFSWDEVEEAVDGRFGVPLAIVFDPALSDQPQVVENAVVARLLPAEEATTGFFGVSADVARETLGPVAGVREAIYQFGQLFGAITAGMADIVTGGALPDFVGDTLTGDINTVHDDITSTDAESRELAARALDSGNPDEERIISIYGAARFGSQITADGLDQTLLFMAGLNVSIGFLNLLPLPPLDGGHVVIATYERIRSIGGRRHEVDYNKVLPVTYAVFGLLTLFGLLAIFRDIIDPINIG